MRLLLLAALICLTFAGTPPAYAIQNFELHFSLDASDHPGLFFTDGYDEGRKFEVKSPAHLEIVNGLARFQLLDPLIVDIYREGKSAQLVYRFIEVKFDPSDLERLEALRLIGSTEVFVLRENGFHPDLTVTETLDFAEESPTLEPLAAKEFKMPELLTFRGENFWLGSFKLEEMQKPLSSKLPNLTLRKIESFDPALWKLTLSRATQTLPASRLLKLERADLTDHATKKFLGIQRKVKEIAEKIQAAADSAGAPENIIRPQFGRPRAKLSCEDDLK